MPSSECVRTAKANRAAKPSRPMQAILRCDYGTADVLRLVSVETPVPGDEELLVRVRAAAVNPLDWHEMRGTPYLMRLSSGLRRPQDLRLGVDFAGTVEAVGAKVTPAPRARMKSQIRSKSG